MGWIGWRLWTWNGAGSLTLASGALLPLWILTVLIVTVQSTGLIAAEKAKQTLDVLLTTPLSSRDIALQKLAGLRRLMLVLAVPLLTMFVTETAWNVYGPRRAVAQGYFPIVETDLSGSGGVISFSSISGQVRNRRGEQVSLFEIDLPQDASMSANSTHAIEPAMTLLGQILGVLVYLPLLGWIGFQFGLRLRTQTQAVWGTLATVGLICVGPSLALRGIEAAQVWLASAASNVHEDGTIHIGGPVILGGTSSGVLDIGSDEVFSGENVVPSRPMWKFGLEWLSPMRVLFPESSPYLLGNQRSLLWWLLLFHFGIALGTLCLLRRNALTRFGRWVHRTEAVAGWNRGGSTKEDPSP